MPPHISCFPAVSLSSHIWKLSMTARVIRIGGHWHCSEIFGFPPSNNTFPHLLEGKGDHMTSWLMKWIEMICDVMGVFKFQAQWAMLAFPLPWHLVMFQGVETLPVLIPKLMEQPQCPHRISMSRVWEIPLCCPKPLSFAVIYLQTIPQPPLTNTDKKISSVPLVGIRLFFRLGVFQSLHL